MDEFNKFDNEDWGFSKSENQNQSSQNSEDTPKNHDASQEVMDWLFNSEKNKEQEEAPKAEDLSKEIAKINMENDRVAERDKRIQRHYRIAGITYVVSILALLVLRVVLKNWSMVVFDASGQELDETLIDFIFTMTLQLGIFIIGVLLLHKHGMKMSTKEVLRQSFIAKPKWWMIVFPLIMGCIMLFATMGFSIFWQIIISFFGYMPASAPSTTTSIEAYLIAVFLTGIMPALGEEFMYRGIVLKASDKYGGFWWGVFATALMFGLGHAYLDQIFYATMLGILSGYMTLKFKNILPAVIIHFMNNTMSVTIDYLQNMNSPIVRFMDLIFESLNGPNAGGAALVLIMLWLLVVSVLILLVFAMRYFFNKENQSQNADLSEADDTQKQAALTELKAGSQGELPQKRASIYPRPLLSGKKLLNFNIRDNVYLLGGFIMAIVATLASLVAGLLL